MNYSNNDIGNNWEFKLLRSHLPIFKQEERLRIACAEEAKVGWIFLEKLDDSRIRFKRPRDIKQRSPDNLSPYRSYYPTPRKDLFKHIAVAVFFTAVTAVATIAFSISQTIR